MAAIGVFPSFFAASKIVVPSGILFAAANFVEYL
jgi:hypothetical protein